MTVFSRRGLVLRGGGAVAALCAPSLLAACTSTGEPMTQEEFNAQAEYTSEEIVREAGDFFGAAAEGVGAAVERVFADNGRPNAYIKGEEGSGAVMVGLRYGKGQLYSKVGAPQDIFWQGPTFGLDTGGNASKVFTLIYHLRNRDQMYQRFPGVEGSAYFVGGLGVNYQQADGVILAPMRAGVGLRLGANIGYLAYTRERNYIPF